MICIRPEKETQSCHAGARSQKVATNKLAIDCLLLIDPSTHATMHACRSTMLDASIQPLFFLF
jgi:hypothetical protein